MHVLYSVYLYLVLDNKVGEDLGNLPVDSGTKSSSGKLRLRFRDRDNGSIEELGLYGFVEELMALRGKFQEITTASIKTLT